MTTNIVPDFALGLNAARFNALRGTKEGKEAERERLKKTAREFELLFVEMMMREMRKNVPESPLLGESNGHKIFQEMLDAQYAKVLVDRGGLGISDMMVQQLSTKL